MWKKNYVEFVILYYREYFVNNIKYFYDKNLFLHTFIINNKYAPEAHSMDYQYKNRRRLFHRSTITCIPNYKFSNIIVYHIIRISLLCIFC